MAFTPITLPVGSPLHNFPQSLQFIEVKAILQPQSCRLSWLLQTAVKPMTNQITSHIGSPLDLDKGLLIKQGILQLSGQIQRYVSSVVRWWTRELSRKQVDVRRLFHWFKANGGWGAYYTPLTFYNKAITTDKPASWGKFILDIISLKAAEITSLLDSPLNLNEEASHLNE